MRDRHRALFTLKNVIRALRGKRFVIEPSTTSDVDVIITPQGQALFLSPLAHLTGERESARMCLWGGRGCVCACVHVCFLLSLRVRVCARVCVCVRMCALRVPMGLAAMLTHSCPHIRRTYQSWLLMRHMQRLRRA